MSEDPELEALKRQRLLQMQQQAKEQEMQKELEMRRQQILRAALTPEARERLTNLKMARPEYATMLENQIIQLAQANQIRQPITDEQLKLMLRHLTERRRESKIIFKKR